jgi:hypothetical protein|tara:strand:+ start:130 stop:357 length:228 start_codon:yes stop_codon:yes gene_type:complete
MNQKYSDHEKRNSLEGLNRHPELKTETVKSQTSVKWKTPDKTRNKTLNLIAAELSKGRDHSKGKMGEGNMQMKWF